MCLELRVFYPYRKPHGREFASRSREFALMSASPVLPAALSAALTARLDGRGRQELKTRAQRLSEAYRARQPTAGTIRDEADALAYALTRLPATYAATIAVLGRLRDEQPDFMPARLLDAGSGTGAAAWAASAVWPDLAQITMLDRSQAFLALARALAADSGVAALEEADFIYTDLWWWVGQENQIPERRAAFMPDFQVSLTLFNKAPSHCKFMHCLPAHRGLEVTDEVLDSPQSIVYDQAENRLHMQKAILVQLLTQKKGRA